MQFEIAGPEIRKPGKYCLLFDFVGLVQSLPESSDSEPKLSSADGSRTHTFVAARQMQHFRELTGLEVDCDECEISLSTLFTFHF
jgi:hypothetical protein